MTSYQYRKSHCGNKTILRPSYLHNGISYTGKMSSLYWIGALEWLTRPWIWPLLAYNTISTSVKRQNDVATSYWRNDDVIIASCARWVTKFITTRCHPQNDNRILLTKDTYTLALWAIYRMSSCFSSILEKMNANITRVLATTNKISRGSWQQQTKYHEGLDNNKQNITRVLATINKISRGSWQQQTKYHEVLGINKQHWFSWLLVVWWLQAICGNHLNQKELSRSGSKILS